MPPALTTSGRPACFRPPRHRSGPLPWPRPPEFIAGRSRPPKLHRRRSLVRCLMLRRPPCLDLVPSRRPSSYQDRLSASPPLEPLPRPPRPSQPPTPTRRPARGLRARMRRRHGSGSGSSAAQHGASQRRRRRIAARSAWACEWTRATNALRSTADVPYRFLAGLLGPRCRIPRPDRYNLTPCRRRWSSGRFQRPPSDACLPPVAWRRAHPSSRLRPCRARCCLRKTRS
jgi:hypothetical protein